MKRSAAIVLCGGQSRRMNTDKAWLAFGDEFLLQRVVRLAAAAAGPVVVVAAGKQRLPELSADVRIARDSGQKLGPLDALSIGLATLDDSVEVIFACGTDLPLLHPAWIERLAELIGDFDAAVPDIGGFKHPLAAAYRRAPALAAARRLLESGRSALVDLVAELNTRFVSADELRDVDPELATLCNVNTLEDYRRARAGEGIESRRSDR